MLRVICARPTFAARAAVGERGVGEDEGATSPDAKSRRAS
jgi:hypothetical protein